MIPVFFIHTGASFDLGRVLGSRQELLLVPVLIPTAYAVKLLPALPYAPAYGRRNALAAGLLLSSRLSLIVTAAAIGEGVGSSRRRWWRRRPW